jgi:hypothetical protein
MEREIKRKAREVNRQTRRRLWANQAGGDPDVDAISPVAAAVAKSTPGSGRREDDDVVADVLDGSDDRDGALETFEKITAGDVVTPAPVSRREVNTAGWSSREAVRVVSLGSSAQGKPDWKPDEAATLCWGCGLTFTMFRRKQYVVPRVVARPLYCSDVLWRSLCSHCRQCGNIFCDACSSGRKVITQLGSTEPQRVCNVCLQV